MLDVIKIGGAADVEHESLAEELADAWANGRRFVLVHGGSGETDRLSRELGRPPHFVTSPSGQTSRVTDRRTLEVFAMATALVNRRLVERLQGLGVNAFGLSGLDGRLAEGKRKAIVRSVEDGRTRVLRDQWTGRIERARPELVRMLVDAGLLPVVAPLASGPKGEMLNVDGDRLAAVLAAALGARRLVILSNVPGLLREFPDERTRIAHVPLDQLDAVKPCAQGRMRKKLLGAEEALRGGVRQVVLGDGRGPRPLARALAGDGTVLGEPLAALEAGGVA